MNNPFKRNKQRNTPAVGIVVDNGNENLCVSGYTSLDKNPEILTGCMRIAEIIGTLTIHLMSNTARGDIRIQNELSKMIDITPMRHMTRKTWIESIVMTMLLYGRGNAFVLPKTEGGLLRELEPIASSRANILPVGYTDYVVQIDGKQYRPDDVLHFVHNPDPLYLWKGRGLQVSLKSVADNLKQAEATKRGFLESKWKPSIIVRVDAMNEAFADPESREKILEDYVQTTGAGTPWVIPGEQVDIETVKPLSLSDLAISDTVEVDKRTVAAVLGVPPFVIGVGNYDAEAWNAFIKTTIKPIVTGMAQEMTRKLILSPSWYIKFNELSLLDWDLKTIASVFCTLGDRGYVDGNEVRDRIGMNPRDGLDELRILENYIPAAMSGQQSKLVGNDKGGEDEQ